MFIGPARKETVNGNIAINIDISEGATVSDSIVVGGACFCSVNGSASVTINGAGENDAFNTKFIIGASSYASGDQKYVSGETTLNFVKFNGTVNSTILFFDLYAIDGMSSVNFMKSGDEFAGKNWDISAIDTDQVSVILSGNNLETGNIHNMDFAGSMLNLSCDLSQGGEWTVFKVLDDSEDLQTLYGFSDATITLNDEEITWEDGELYGESDTCLLEYRFDEDEGTGMLVASLA